MRTSPGSRTLLLSRPPTNTLTRQMYRELTAAAAELALRDDVSAVIVFGGHEIFSVGDDLAELQTLDARGVATAEDACHRAIDAVAAIPKPTVAAVTGYALGSGLSLALAADWRVSGDNVKFGATEILDGLVPRAAGPPGWPGRSATARPRTWCSADGSRAPRKPWSWASSTRWRRPTTCTTRPSPGRAGSRTLRPRPWLPRRPPSVAMSRCAKSVRRSPLGCPS